MELVHEYRRRAETVREAAKTERDGFTRRDMLLLADLLDLAAARRELLIRSYFARAVVSTAASLRSDFASREPQRRPRQRQIGAQTP